MSYTVYFFCTAFFLSISENGALCTWLFMYTKFPPSSSSYEVWSCVSRLTVSSLPSVKNRRRKKRPNNVYAQVLKQYDTCKIETIITCKLWISFLRSLLFATSFFLSISENGVLYTWLFMYVCARGDQTMCMLLDIHVHVCIALASLSNHWRGITLAVTQNSIKDSVASVVLSGKGLLQCIYLKYI